MDGNYQGTGVMKMDPCGKVLIVHTPSREPFASWKEQGEQKDDEFGNSDKQGADKRTDDDLERFKALCSSDILRLVSPLMRKSLDGRWRESGPDAEGICHVSLEGFDSVALQYVLNVLHHRPDFNPENLKVETLAKIAMLVDYLGCHQAFLLAGRVWASGYKGVPEREFGRPVVLWLLVSTVFALKPIFDSAAMMAITHGTEPLDTLGLPIEEKVVELVDKHRQERIGILVRELYKLKEKLQSGSGCMIECDSFHLGRLLIEMRKRQLDPPPCEPYNGISIFGIRKMVGEFGLATGRGPVYLACHERLKWEDRNACGVSKALKRISETAKLEYNLGIVLGKSNV